MSYSLAFSQGVGILVLVAVKVERGVYDFVPTRKLAEILQIAVPSAVKILQSLSRAGMIETREGSKGGVRLAKDPADITLLDVFHAIENERPLFRTDIRTTLNSALAKKVLQSLQSELSQSEQAMKQSLQNVSIADLYREK